MTIDLHPAADELSRIIGGIGPSQLDDPTPCAGSDVATILAHVVGLTLAFRDAARKVEGPTTQTAPDAAMTDLPSDWSTLIPQQLREMADAWDPPEAWEGESTAGGVTLPSAQTAAFANDELVIHAWDLAVATHQTPHLPRTNLHAAYALASAISDDSPARQGGLFGPMVPVPESASLLDRTLGATGRDPHWSPPAR